MVGRSSESIFTIFGISDWDSKEGFWSSTWKEPQTGKEESTMPFAPDADSWEIVIFYCLVCLLINSISNTINYIFPHYSTRNKHGAILDTILKECEPHVESLYKGVTSSALRDGTADEIVYNNKCSIISVISRDVWD